MTDNDKSYLDENLTEPEKKSGQTRLPQPETEGQADGQERDDRETLNPDRDDEFGDGDRRS